MVKSLKPLFYFWMGTLFLPTMLQSQIYNNSKKTELSDHLFGLDYFPASWQTSVFEEEFYSPKFYKENVQFNKLSNALRLNYSGTEKMLSQFKEDYPNSISTKTIDLDVANYYFKNEKYRYALKWFNRISDNKVPKNDLATYNFNKGYTLFSSKNYKKARLYLEKVKNDSKYESDAHYYLGHIAYQLEDFDSAIKSFGNISNPSQKENLNYFQADINFRLGRFEQAVELANKAMIDANIAERSELSKIIGESYFNIKSYTKAVPFLEAYEGKKGTLDNNDYYQLGYAYFKKRNFDKAIAQFNKIVGKKNALSQNAYYSLAECYIQTNQKLAALNAFKSASGMDFNSIIKEDAFLNYAKLSYDIGNPYQDPPKVLLAFLEAYPKNAKVELVGELLINSYTKNGNYTAALEILENKKGYKNNENLQRVLILAGIQQFNNERFLKASNFFKRGLRVNENKTLEAFCLYWYGRSEYERNKFDEALDLFKEFGKHAQKKNVVSVYRLNYDIGYVYFKLGEYQYALQSFEAFNQNNSSLDLSYHRDTYLRMGDCRFALKNYWAAMENYNTSILINPKKGAYATFQKAISYGFVERNSKKIVALSKFITTYPKNELLDDVLFELASAFSREGENEKAIEAYDKLIFLFETSPFLAKSALNKALILYNQEKYDLAKAILEKVAIRYNRYAVGEQAVRTLKEIAIDQGSISTFVQWTKDQKLDTFTDIELEKTTFNAAERQFLEGNINSALKLFEEYFEVYPQGSFSKVVLYYLAEIYFEMERFDDALIAYENLIQGSVSIYTEKALTRIILLLKNNNQQIKAIPYMEKLIEISSFNENKRFAILNLMQAYYFNEQYQKTIEITEQVLKLPDITENIKWDALKLNARSSLSLLDSLKAQKSYRLLENSSEKFVAAEAMYYRAYDLYRKEAYSESNRLIAKIAENSGQAKQWNVKSLMLLAKNYYALEDPFQAIFALESLIENFEAYPETIEEARNLLLKYQVSIAKENRSIDNNDSNG
jgi:tetratricopeptide (TPR) repeat protein